MIILFGTHQGFDERNINTYQGTVLVYWDKIDIVSFPDAFGFYNMFACSGSIFIFFCWWYSGELVKEYLWLKWQCGGTGPIKFVAIDSHKSFMFIAMGFSAFLAYI